MTNHTIQLDNIRAQRRILALITYGLVLCMLFVFYSPSALAMRYAIGQQSEQTSYTDELMMQLQILQDNTEKAIYYARKPAQREQALAIYRQTLLEIQPQLVELAEHSRNEINNELADAVALQDRHNMTLTKRLLGAYDVHWPVIADNLMRQTRSEHASLNDAQALHRHLNKIQFGRTHHQYDNDQLPFGPLPNVAHRPADSIQALQARLGIPSQGESSPLEQLQSSQRTETQDLSAYLALNVDTAHTAELAQLAASLSSDPVQIFQYVYNNIEYVPAFGSIQGADYTRQTQRGNAFDQASLMVSLLRLSGVPARYVYGSVEVDPEQVKNWVGGVEVIEAAQNLLGQGGVPNVIVKGAENQVVSYGLEHVWVEFYQDGQWQAADPSFKQYEYSEGIDLTQVASLDQDVFVSELTDGATIEPTEKWVKGLNESAAYTKIESIQNQLEDYLALHLPDASFEDIFGSKVIVTHQNIDLPNLPYSRVIASQSLANIPDNLRHKYRFTLQSGGSAHLQIEKSLPELLGKRIALSFKPASEADWDKLSELVPNEQHSSSEIPTSLPYGFINVKAQFTINEFVIGEGGVFPIGQELQSDKGFWTPRFGWERTNSPLVAGEYHALSINAHGISEQTLEDLQLRLAQSEQKIQADNLSTITSHDFTGLIVQAGILSYWTSVQTQDRLNAKLQNIISYDQPSYGSFSTTLNVSYWFGVPRNVSFGGVTMDIDHKKGAYESKTNCWNDWSEFNRLSGNSSSLMENIVPQQLFSAPGTSLRGVSAVEALGFANETGQVIYTLNSSNRTLLDNIQIDEEARIEIATAITSGKVVTVHEKPINLNSWQGSGYIIMEPTSGSAAYKISGGENGGFLELVDEHSAVLGLVGLGLTFLGAKFAMLALLISVLTAVATFVAISVMTSEKCPAALVDMYIVLIGVLTIIGAIWGKGLGGILGFWLGTFVGGGAIQGTLQSKYCTTSLSA
ncbi:transglutaminase domain-containing protein [Pseudoalteromonas rubra]|uniref:transglutaminase domain-containing protein n=1 Tax=Pseudoalteromonas rubra TaxID=43658 RepID=UPI000F76E491|nr:transglutaminase domain-containing protein [Pseudoalteromonas rubra]